MSAFLDRLRERKLVQWIVGYLAGAWVCLQVLAFFGDQFHWSDRIVPAATVFLAIGFLAALLLAWRHGEQGRQQAGAVEAAMLAAILLGATTAGVLVFRRAGAADENARVGAVTSADRSIAVLPFVNRSDSKENEYFSDGITEDVLTNLSKIGSLRVISRTSVMRYKGSDKSVPEIARELGVANVLEGSVRRVGNQVRITATLIRAGGEAHLWADSYDRDIADIFAVQTEIASKIAGALTAHLSPREAERIAARPTESLEAYDRFLQGRERYLRDGGKDDIEAAIDLLREAVALDPDFGLALAFLTRAYSQRTRWRGGAGDDIAWADSAMVTGARAIAAQPDAPDGYSALGETYRGAGRYPEALEQYRRALAIDPNHAYSLAEIGETHGTHGLGNLDEAIRWLNRAITSDPSQGWMYRQMAENYRTLGDYDAAEQWLERGERTAYYGREGTFTAYAVLEADRGDWAAAKARIDAWIAENGDSQTDRMNAAILALNRGNEALAREYAKTVTERRFQGSTYYLWLLGDRAAIARAPTFIRRQLDTRTRIQRGSSAASLWLTLASDAAMLGEKTATLENIEQYVNHGGRDHICLTRNPVFANVRADPRFVAAIARLRAELDRQREALRKTPA